ncbi:radical SAM protein [Candidatus Woesearchaeota archaeon]|nr:radical SAM protein [Candidatus Woesearchaeota archaeon]
MKKFYICGGWCPRRKLDAQRIYNYFVKNGWKFTKNLSSANIIIIYTCGSFDRTEERSLLTVAEMLKKKSLKTKVIVTGCLVKINPQKIVKKEDIIVIPHEKLSRLDKIIDAKAKFSSVADVNVPSAVPDLLGKSKDILSINALKKYLKNISKKVLKINHKSSTSYRILISRGCLGVCTYCVIRFAHGRLKSKPLNKVISEFKSGLRQGYKLFELQGEDIGCYGFDIGTNIVELLKKIFAHKGTYKLVLENFNPQWLIKFYADLLPLFLRNKERIKYIMVPIQSGSNSVLKLMRRPYSIEEVRACLKDLKRKIPDLELQTHILVGFPGEKEKDFNESKKILREIDFADVYVYEYQDRPHTEASKMKNKNSNRTKLSRFNRLSRFVNISK